MDSWMDGAPEVDWGPEHTVTTFAPAQRSWQWVTGGNHAGAAGVNGGTGCSTCHSGDEISLGASLVGADDDPIPGKRGHVEVTIQAAYDSEKFYLRASWQTQRPGVTHDIFTFDGTNWVRNSREKPEELAAGEVYSREDRFALMFLPASRNVDAQAGHLNNFHNVGCWLTCHEDLTDMPNEGDPALYALDPGGEITKYLKISRVGDGGYDALTTDIAALMAAGQFPDMWHYRGARSAPVQSLTDGFVMATRASDAGTNPYFTQPNLHQGVTAGGWMYDINVMGFHALPAEQWADNLDNAPPLITSGPGMNAVPFDPNVQFNAGDILPRRALRAVTVDSRNDVIAYTAWQDGTWTVILERNRDTGHADDHVLDPDVENYTFAFAIFEDHAGGRWHHVSFPVTLGTAGSPADIQAQPN